jgi:translation initiation factor IF-2
MSKVRVNDLARELEVKSKAILDALSKVGVTEKKTHSSSIEEHEAEKVRLHIRSFFEGHAQAARSSLPLRREEEIKTKVDLSRISRPGDVLKAITKKQSPLPSPSRSGHNPATRPGVRVVPGQPIYRRPIVSSAEVKGAGSTPAPQAQSRRLVVPQSGPRPVYTVRETKAEKTVTVAQSEPTTMFKDAIEEAEQILKALRMEDQNHRRGGKSDS